MIIDYDYWLWSSIMIIDYDYDLLIWVIWGGGGLNKIAFCLSVFFLISTPCYGWYGHMMFSDWKDLLMWE